VNPRTDKQKRGMWLIVLLCIFGVYLIALGLYDKSTGRVSRWRGERVLWWQDLAIGVVCLVPALLTALRSIKESEVAPIEPPQSSTQSAKPQPRQEDRQP
jgi:hypothetical protein